MTTDATDIDAFLDGSALTAYDATSTILDESTLDSKAEIIDLNGEVDPRLKLISHSSRLAMHTCPRKFQLYRLSSKQIALDDGGEKRVTFDYGTVVGLGIQNCLEGKTLERTYFDMFCEWEGDLFLEIKKNKKNFWSACLAVKKFFMLRENNYLNDYELVYHEGKPAVELSFRIHLPNGYKYRGYVDAVLRHKVTGAIIVLELKTTGMQNVNSAMYKNSGQAIGYSIVLDSLFPEENTYTVLYLVYSTKNMEYIELPFEKSRKQRALWLQELLIEVETLGIYESYDTYPMYGESCFDFYRECEYLGLCTLNTVRLVKPYTTADAEKIAAESYMFDVDFYDLVADQLTETPEVEDTSPIDTNDTEIIL